MDHPPQSGGLPAPRPRPRTRRPVSPVPPTSSQPPLPSQAPPPSQPPQLSQAPPPSQPSRLSRPGVLVEATQPFNVHDPAGMIRWLLGTRIGDVDKVKEVMVCQDGMRAFVELSHPTVIPQLLSKCGILQDPHSQQPLYASQIDLTTVWPPYVSVTGFPPFVNEQMIREHFEMMAGGQQVQSVHISEDRQKAMVIYAFPTVAFDVISSQTQLLGSDLHLELCYYGPSPAEPTAAPQAPTAPQEGVASLCVQGLPESMLNDPSLISAALKHFIKQSTGFEATHCEIVNGVGYLTFADPSAAQAIVADPPTTTFMAGSALYMSLASPAQHNPPEAPHAERGPPKEAWGTPAGGQLPGSVSPNRERPSTAPIKQSDRPPVALRRRYLSDDKANEDLHPHSGDQAFGTTGGGYSQLSNDPSKFQQQQNLPQSSFGQMPHSASSPEGLGHGQSQFGQQLPVPGHRYPPQQPRHAPQHRQTQSANYPLPGHNQPMQLGDSWHGSEAQSMFQPGQQSIHTAGHPPTDSAVGVPTTTSQTGFCRKVLVNNLPNSEAKNTAALRYYLLGLAGHTNDVSVTMHKNCAVATFNNPINLEALSQQSKQSPFEGAMLTLSTLMPSDKIIVSGLNDGISETLLKFGLSHHAGEFECVKAVERISPSQAMVTFKSPESAQKVLSKSQLDLDGHPLITKEYYDFMDANETDFTPQQDGQPPTTKAAQHVWCAQKEQLTKEQLFYLEQSLSELNDKLLPLKACAEIESKCLVISPLKDAGAVDNWEDQVTTVHKEHLEGLCTEIVSFPKDAKADVQDFVYDRSDSILVVKREKLSIIIAGKKDVIAEACEKIAEMCLEHQITTREIDLQRKHVKYLAKFCHQDFQKLGHVVCDFEFKPDVEKVIVTAYPNGHSEVDEIIGRMDEATEKNITLSHSAFKLLSSQRGTKKLNEIFDVLASQLVYDLEQYQDSSGETQYRIIFLSKRDDVLKKVKHNVKLYTHEEGFLTSAAKIRVCSSKEWRDFVSNLCDESFVAITADEASSRIIVTGEKLACPDVVDRVRKFLAKHTNIEERLVVNQSEWCIISSNFNNEVNGINEQAKRKQVKVEWPKKMNASSLSIVISGEPGVVDDIKVQVTMLVAKVCKKEARIAGVPAVVHVLESMGDKIRLLETDERVRIDVNLENGDNGTAAATQTVGEVPRQVCSGTSPDGCRVSVYTGDSTQNAPVGVIVNFITPDPNPQMGHLKHLLESGGLEATEDFRRKISQFIELKPGNVFKTRVGQLRCSQLVHCVLPSWKSSSESDVNKEFFLEEALTQVMQDASMSGSMLLMPLTSAPLHYPVNLFARLVMDAVTYQATSPNLHISVYVEELQHAKEFEGALQTRHFQVHTKVPLGSPLLSAGRKAQETASPTTASAKTITSNLSSFISVVKGDLLQQQADVYINSTNTNLNLKQGQLSKLLLNACGDNLQKECSEYAPLKPGKVAVTDTKNLKCSHIFHVALPEYQTANSERLFRETVKQILCIGKNMSVSSIAIPSLGVANLGFPANVSARILFQEVIAFHAQYPNSIQKFVFVIYEKTVFQAFSKEFADQMSGGTQPQASQDPTPAKGYASAPQPAGSTLLSIVQGNIAEERSDIIVNTTTEDMMLNKSAVSKAIAEKAGEELQKTCRQLFENGMRLEHGQIVLTPAPGKLRCKKLIHAHIPHRGSMAKSSNHHYQLIDKIVTDCLQKAESSHMQSISFPAFGLGGGGYAVDQVAEPMLKAFQKFGQTHPQSVKSIRVVIYDQDLYKLFNEFYCKFFGRSSADPLPPQGIFSRILGSSQKPDNSQELQASAVAPVKRTSGAPPLWALSRSVPNPIVVFQIFAASDAQCNRIEQKLRDLISEKSTSKEIKDNEVIEHLLDDDFHDLVQIGDRLGVQVRVLPKIREIRISGEKSKVAEAHSDIQKILHDIERSKTDLISFEWQSEDDDGMYETYSPEANIRLERAYSRGAKAVELIIDGVAVVIDLQNNIETDKTTGKRRNIRRAKKTVPSFDFPPTWESLQQKKNAENMQMFEVDQGSQEYADAKKEFEESMNKWGYKFSIEKVQRIENRVEYTKHMALNESVKEKYQKKDVLVKRLFHGSRFDSVQLIAVQGFNRNFAADANAAYFGKGVYFAVEAGYSAQDKYSVADSSGLRYMFVCRVIIGKYAQGSNNMKTAPPLSPGSREVHDTLCDKESAPTIFVAMTDAQAYPEYLITFKKMK